MQYEIVSYVYMDNSPCKYTYTENFAEEENVFGRILMYHEHMNKLFPNFKYKVLSVNPIKSKNSK